MGAGEVVEGEVEVASGFEELVQAARPTLLHVAQSVTGQRADAEDAVQTSLLKAMGAWQRVAGQERWRQQAYVRQIVVNTCRSSWRKWGSRIHVGDVPELAQHSTTDPVEDRELVRQALSQLPARQRAVLVLRYYEDFSEADIAERLGCAPGTVKSSAARALRTLPRAPRRVRAPWGLRGRSGQWHRCCSSPGGQGAPVPARRRSSQPEPSPSGARPQQRRT